MSTGFILSAPSSGQGKTAVTLGLLRAVRRAGVSVASGKSGPDYIDPAFHRAATGRACLTLDAWAMDADTLRGRASGQAAELLVVEGAMGLLDGPIGREPSRRIARGSTADLAATLGLPVVLVLDARHMGQSAGAIVAGFKTWSEQIEIAGVVLNRVASARHEAMLRAAVEQICPIFGVVPPDTRLAMPSRHLGLVQAGENAELDAFLDHAADCIAAHCDLDGLRALAGPVVPGKISASIPPLGQRVAIARDVAFSFLYPHQVVDWRAAGAEVRFFSPLRDEAPDPDSDAVFLPGGYPELHAGKLAGNSGFLTGLRDAASRGALVYGECGGYMVLGEGLIDADGTRHRMAGLLPLETSFAERKRHLGYRSLTPLGGPWTTPLAAHEFHYSTELRAEGPPLFGAEDSTGTALPDMGLIHGTVMGSYAHVIA